MHDRGTPRQNYYTVKINFTWQCKLPIEKAVLCLHYSTWHLNHQREEPEINKINKNNNEMLPSKQKTRTYHSIMSSLLRQSSPQPTKAGSSVNNTKHLQWVLLKLVLKWFSQYLLFFYQPGITSVNKVPCSQKISPSSCHSTYNKARTIFYKCKATYMYFS